MIYGDLGSQTKWVILTKASIIRYYMVEGFRFNLLLALKVHHCEKEEGSSTLQVVFVLGFKGKYCDAL